MLAAVGKKSVERPRANPILVLFICYGSATTMFYWTKWMSKLISFTDTEIKVRDVTKKDEMFSLSIHAVLMIALCVLFPLLSKVYVEPLLVGMFGTAMSVLPSSVLMLLVVKFYLLLGYFAIP